jgi:hypothetical protein
MEKILRLFLNNAILIGNGRYNSHGFQYGLFLCHETVLTSQLVLITLYAKLHVQLVSVFTPYHDFRALLILESELTRPSGSLRIRIVKPYHAEQICKNKAFKSFNQRLKT